MAMLVQHELADSPEPEEDEELEDDVFAKFLEANVDAEEEDGSVVVQPAAIATRDARKHVKRRRQEFEYYETGGLSADSMHFADSQQDNKTSLNSTPTPYTGSFAKLPVELYWNILKFLSAEDLSTCAAACRFMREASSDEEIWRRVYCLRWGAPKDRPCIRGWKKVYFERDAVDMHEFVQNSPEEFREYYVQMQATKRNQAPRFDQIHDDLVVLDSVVADEIAAWRQSQNLPDLYKGNHFCNGRQCSYHKIGNVYLCEGTGKAHECAENCKEIVLDPDNELLVCSVSGRCFDRWLTPEEEEEADIGHLQGSNAPEVEGREQLVGPGPLGQAYSLGYCCDDEKELFAAQRSLGLG